MEKMAKTSFSPIDILSKTWEVYKQIFGTLIGISLIPLVILAILVVVGFTGILGFAGGAVNFFSLGGIAIVLALLIMLAYIWSYVAMLVAIRDRDRKPTIWRSYQTSGPLLLSYFWIALLVGLIEMGGFILLIIPGIIFAIWFMFSDIILVAEGKKGLEALLKSKEYVRGLWWKLFWIVLFFTIFAIIVSGGLGFLFAYLLTSINLPPIADQIINLFFIPFAAAFMYMVYEELKKAKSGMKMVVASNEKTKWALAAVWGVVSIILIFVLFFYTLSVLISQFN